MATEYYDAGGENFASATDVDDSAKLFVGGLNWETTTEEIQTYFEQFGKVVEVVLKTDHETGLPRGFGFVGFADPASVDRVLEVSTHLLHGKYIDPKRIKQRPTLSTLQKIFVGGIDPQMPESSIRDYFSQFGTIDELDWPTDRATNNRRRFCFIRFTTNEPIDWLCLRPRHTICGKSVEVKKAVTKAELKPRTSTDDVASVASQGYPPVYQQETYSAAYNTDSYQFPLGRGLSQSYVKYQMYTNQPGYNAPVGQYGYDNGNVAASNSTYNPAASVAHASSRGSSGRGRATGVQRYQPYNR